MDDGIVAPVQLHGYIVSQREIRWPIQKRIAWISSQYDLLFSHSSEFPAGDVDHSKITLEHVDSILTLLRYEKLKVEQLRKQLFDPVHVTVKEWKSNELKL